MAHKCPVEGCVRNVPDTLLMCKPHWFRVPAPMRMEVWKTWSALNAEHIDMSAAACRRRVEGYRQAKQAAIDAVNGRLQRTP